MASSPSPRRSPLRPAEIVERLRAQFGDDLLDGQDSFGQAVLTVGVGRYRELVLTLRDDPAFAFDYPDFVSAVDYQERGFEVVTQLHSIRHGNDVRIRVPIADRESPSCPSISDLYPGANFHERETWEMFGIDFEGHPQLVKLLLPEQFEGNPLRKDFVLMSRVAKPWPGAAEGEEAEEE